MNDAIVWLTLALLSVGWLTDVRRLEMPPAISSAILLLAAAKAGVSGSAAAWLSAAAGMFVACCCVAVLWRGGWCGGGDASALAALGAVVGIGKVASLLFCVAVAGGGVAVVALLRGKCDFEYPPAVTAGFLLFVMTRGAP